MNLIPVHVCLKSRPSSIGLIKVITELLIVTSKYDNPTRLNIQELVILQKEEEAFGSS